MLLILAIVFTAVPVRTEAAAKVPAKVTAALKRAVDDNGRAIIIDQSGKMMYLYKRNSKTRKWELKKSFRCICGNKLDPKMHYMLLRNDDTDQRIYTNGSKSYEFGVYVDCYEEAMEKTVRIHSYATINGKTYKDSAHNTCGIAVCIDNAYHIYRYYGDGTALMVC